MIDLDHGPMADEMANEDEFVPNDDSVIEVEVIISSWKYTILCIFLKLQ